MANEFTEFAYRNHRGIIAARRIVPEALIFDFVNHPEYGYVQPQWFLHGRDLDRDGAVRSFALANIVVDAPNRGGQFVVPLLHPRTFGLPIS